MATIVIEIGDDYYEKLGIAREDLEGLSDEEITRKLRGVRNRAGRDLQQRSFRGDRAAEKLLAELNEVSQTLANAERRQQYEREHPGLELFRIQDLTPPYYNPANGLARVRFVSWLMSAALVEGVLWSLAELERQDFSSDFTSYPSLDEP
jgi:hypothetical protein